MLNERLGAMRVGDIENRDGESQTQRSINRTVETRKAGASFALEEADQPKIADRSRKQHESQGEGKPCDPSGAHVRKNEAGADGYENCATCESDSNRERSGRRRHECRPAMHLGNRCG